MQGVKTKFDLPTVFVIFGITGDLVQKKLLSALFDLHRKQLLPKKFEVIGFSRRRFNDEELRHYLVGVMTEQGFSHKSLWNNFLANFYHIEGRFDNHAAYEKLAHTLGRVDGQWQVCANKLFYLAVPPQFYRTILHNLYDSGLTVPCSPKEGWTRIILEKPFGHDLKNAKELDKLLGQLFKEEQIYRVDHFLGKETVRNILAFRFSNSFLAPSWNSKYIEKIEIKFHEKDGVAGRGDFYDNIGALRDVGQNHLLQLLALFTMSHPIDFTSGKIGRKCAAILSSLKKMTADDVARNTRRGQYEGYHKESGVSPGSKTETYFSIKTELDTPRWRGVTIFIEAGKAMTESKLEVIVSFKHQTPCLCPPEKHYHNVFRYQIQPREKISMNVLVKKPGHGFILQKQDFLFDYKKAYKNEEFIEAYEKLLLDMIKGDQTLFVSTEEIFYEWYFVEPILATWKNKNQPPLVTYKSKEQYTS